jgi:hypothetical protein
MVSEISNLKPMGSATRLDTMELIVLEVYFLQLAEGCDLMQIQRILTNMQN